MARRLELERYRRDVQGLRRRAEASGMPPEALDKIFEDCFWELRSRQAGAALKRSPSIFRPSAAKVLAGFAATALLLYVLLNVHQPTSSIVLRNVQSLIYPGLKVLRSLAVPVIRRFPEITSVYDETCLVENPFFFVTNMECWPCENVHSVVDLSSESTNQSLYQYSEIPYVVRTSQPRVPFEDLRALYEHNRDTFDQQANHVRSSGGLRTLAQLFARDTGFNESSGDHVSWRINKMLPARLIRSLFPRPRFVPERAGQSMERFVLLDGGKSAKSRSLPDTECSYVFVTQGCGERTVVLRPSRECEGACRTVSVLLRPSYVQGVC